MSYNYLRIPKRLLLNEATQGRLSKKEIDSTINRLVTELQDFRYELTEISEKVYKCEHEYHKERWSCQRRVIGYVYVYERTCKHCGQQDIVTCKEESDAPEWASKALQRTYNNY